MFRTKLTYFENLDGLRGLAAFSVLVFHFFLSPKVTSSLTDIELVKKITEILQHGVTLFFVLSGFVITRILLNNRTETNYFSKFYKRRALRIFPLYYLYLIIHFYVYPILMGAGPNLNFERQIPIFLYLQNLGWLTGLEVIGPGHFWSLAVEEHFYLIWPLIIFIIPNNRIQYVVTIFLIIFSIPLKALFLQVNIDINYNTFSRYDSILMGGLIAIIERKNNYKLPKIKSNFILGLLLGLFFVGLLIYIFQDRIFFIKSITKHFILSLFFGLIIYYSAYSSSNKNLYNKFLTSKIMQYFGKISYGLYVWHILAINVCAELAINNTMINLLLTSLITVIFAHVSFYYYEQLFLKYK
jgi:peptidoglycan/LPS O-acetylase OafA/YrhL